MNLSASMKGLLLLLSSVVLGVGIWLYFEFEGEDYSGDSGYTMSKAWAADVDEIVTELLEERAGISAHNLDLNYRNIDGNPIDLFAYAERFSMLEQVNETYVLGECPLRAPYTCYVDVSGNHIVFLSNTYPPSVTDFAGVREVLQVFNSGRGDNGITYFDWRVPNANQVMLLEDSGDGALMQVKVPPGIEVVRVVTGLTRLNNRTNIGPASLDIGSAIEVTLPLEYTFSSYKSEIVDHDIFNTNQLLDLRLSGNITMAIQLFLKSD